MNNEIQEIIDLAAGQGIVLDPCLLRDYPLGTWFWAIHHQIIAEPLTEPLADRIKYILTQKDQSERAVRLKALRPVMKPDGQAEDDKAGAAYAKVRAEYNKVRAECDKAGAEYNKELFTQWGEEYPDHPIWDKNGLAF